MSEDQFAPIDMAGLDNAPEGRYEIRGSNGLLPQEEIYDAMTHTIMRGVPRLLAIVESKSDLPFWSVGAHFRSDGKRVVFMKVIDKSKPFSQEPVLKGGYCNAPNAW